jgi:hypothetical protein
MKNDHMIPVAIKNIVEGLYNNYSKEIEKEYNAQRLEAIRDYCIKSLQDYNKNKFKYKHR